MASISSLVIFGASGDLMARYLLPALAELQATGRLHQDLTLVAVDRHVESSAALRDRLAERVAAVAPSIDATACSAVLDRLVGAEADVTDAGSVRTVLERAGEGPVAAYLALPNTVFAPAVEALAAAGLPEDGRIVIEKPFGEDLASARSLNAAIHASFGEGSVFRVDHFLGMQTVLDLLGLRFANRLVAPLWCAEHVAAVDIVWDETLTLEGRAGYYDGAGALRDMLQNHLLQLLCLVAMDPPASLEAEALRDAKVELLRRVEPPPTAAMAERTVRARYTAGRIGDRDVPDYVAEDGVEPERGTETFAEVLLSVEHPRWEGVPFRLRTGKALGADRREVVLHLRPVDGSPFADLDGHAAPNAIRIGLEPDTLSFDLLLNGAGDPFDLEPVRLEADFPDRQLSAYARLVGSLLEGDLRLSIRDDEAEEAWRIMDPVLQAWQRDEVPLLEYEAGSDGPGARGLSPAPR